MAAAAGLVGAVALGFLAFMSAMARFLKRPSPSEAIIRIGRATPTCSSAARVDRPGAASGATMSLSTIGLTIRRASHEALVTKDYISTNLSAEFYIRVEPAEDDVKKAARTIASTKATPAPRPSGRNRRSCWSQAGGALRAVAAQNDFLALHMNREHFAQEVSKALREDLGRNGFTLESVTITELAQTPLAEMRADDIFGASGRETVTNTVVQKNIAVKRKVQEEAERTAEIAREQEINVATQNRIMREGKAKEEEAAVKAESRSRKRSSRATCSVRPPSRWRRRGRRRRSRRPRSTSRRPWSRAGRQAEDHRGRQGRQGDHAHPQGKGERGSRCEPRRGPGR